MRFDPWIYWSPVRHANHYTKLSTVSERHRKACNRPQSYLTPNSSNSTNLTQNRKNTIKYYNNAATAFDSKLFLKNLFSLVSNLTHSEVISLLQHWFLIDFNVIRNSAFVQNLWNTADFFTAANIFDFGLVKKLAIIAVKKFKMPKKLLEGSCILHNFHFNFSAINFFLYCIAGSKFRTDCVALLCCRGKETRHNKKVLLRERKRHTARCVANTPYVVLTGYPPLGGTRSGTPPGGPGTPRGGTRSGTPQGGPGIPRGGTQSGTPRGVWVPPAPGGVPGQVPPRGGTRSGTPRGGTWTPPPPPVDRQTPVKTVPSRRTTYAGGNKTFRSKDASTLDTTSLDT